MDIFIIRYYCRNGYLVITDGDVYVYKDDKYKFDPPFLSSKPKHIFIGQSKVCKMTEFFGVSNDGFDGNTFLLECEDIEYVHISGHEIFKFKTDDKLIDYISLMGINFVLYAIIFGENYTYFVAHHYNVIENDKIEERTLLNPFDYHLEKCGVDSFKKLERSLIHTFWPGVGKDIQNEDDDLVEADVVEEDDDLIEMQYLNGNNEVVKIFNQKCVICYEKESVYAFRHCGHQCICEGCYQNKGDIDISKCVVCRT